MMVRDIVYLDIETIPDKMPNLDAECFRTGISTAQMHTEVGIDMLAANFEAEAKKRALSNIDCRIISISYAINDEPVVNLFDGMHEKDLIERLIDSELMNVLKKDQYHSGYYPDTLVCAYNALQFDLPVIATKLFKYGFKEFVPAIPYRESEYHWSNKVFDPMEVFPYTYNERWLTQSRMAEYLGIDDDAEMKGSMVYQAYLDFHYDEIVKYNNQDVDLLRKICKKIMI